MGDFERLCKMITFVRMWLVMSVVSHLGLWMHPGAPSLLMILLHPPPITWLTFPYHTGSTLCLLPRAALLDAPDKIRTPNRLLGQLCLLSAASGLWAAPVLQVCFVSAAPLGSAVPRCLLKAASISPYSGPHSISVVEHWGLSSLQIILRQMSVHAYVSWAIRCLQEK